MRTATLKPVLVAMMRARLPFLLSGAPGVGKTDIVAQAAAEAGCDLLISHPVVCDPTDFKGLPARLGDSDVATFLPYDDLARALHASRPTVWMLDDLGQATPAVQAAAMQLLLARQLNGKALPDHVTFAAATNRRQDRAGVQGILEPVKSRFATIIEVEADPDGWTEWAVGAGVEPLLIAFLQFRGALLHVPAPSADMQNSPSPRTWVNVARLEQAGIPRAALLDVVTGAVGRAAATEYLAFRTVYETLPDPAGALLAPDKAPVPTEPSACYAISAALAEIVTRATFGNLVKYMERLPSRDFLLFATQVAYGRDPSIAKCPAWTTFTLSPAGRAFLQAA
jgi:hypothetical protein